MEPREAGKAVIEELHARMRPLVSGELYAEESRRMSRISQRYMTVAEDATKDLPERLDAKGAAKALHSVAVHYQKLAEDCVKEAQSLNAEPLVAGGTA